MRPGKTPGEKGAGCRATSSITIRFRRYFGGAGSDRQNIDETERKQQDE